MPAQSALMIAGPNGASVTDMEVKFGCEISFDKNFISGPERAMKIVGRADRVRAVLDTVYHRVEQLRRTQPGAQQWTGLRVLSSSTVSSGLIPGGGVQDNRYPPYRPGFPEREAFVSRAPPAAQPFPEPRPFGQRPVGASSAPPTAQQQLRPGPYVADTGTGRGQYRPPVPAQYHPQSSARLSHHGPFLSPAPKY